MPSSEKHGSTMFFSSFRRSAPVRNDPVMSVEPAPHAVDTEQDSFQQGVYNQFHELSEASADEFLSISWIQKLLDAFTTCQEEFRVILSHKKEQLSHPPVEKLLSEFFDRSIKALDICNASRDGIEKIRQWQKNLDIVLCVLDCRERLGEAQFRRARKALMDLPLLMIDDKQIGGAMSTHRNRSFGRRAGKNKDHHNRQSGTSSHSRSLSWSVPVSWSASKQIQSIASNLVPPRGNDALATNGLAITIYTMSFILLFVLWTLVIALPCQDRGHQIHFAIPRHFSWSPSFALLHNRITDELKKQERKESFGLLTEIYKMEKRISHMTDLVDAVEFPLTEEQNEEVKEGVRELRLVYDIFKDKLDPLDRHLREVFRKIMSCRNDGLQSSGIN